MLVLVTTEHKVLSVISGLFPALGQSRDYPDATEWAWRDMEISMADER